MKIIKGDLILKKNTVFNESIQVGGDIKGGFNLTVVGDIDALKIHARDIIARNINARDIDARDIDAEDINALKILAENIIARDISYYAVCFALNNITCKSIKGCTENSKHFCLDGKIKENEKKRKKK